MVLATFPSLFCLIDGGLRIEIMVADQPKQASHDYYHIITYSNDKNILLPTGSKLLSLPHRD